MSEHNAHVHISGIRARNRGKTQWVAYSIDWSMQPASKPSRRPASITCDYSCGWDLPVSTSGLYYSHRKEPKPTSPRLTPRSWF